MTRHVAASSTRSPSAATTCPSLVGNANATARAIGDENVALARSLDLAPETLRSANTTFVNLRSTLDDLDVLVAESKPATVDLARFFRELRPLVRDAQPTVRDLRNLIRTPGPDNDLIELTKKAPKLQSLSSRVFPRSIRGAARVAAGDRVHPARTHRTWPAGSPSSARPPRNYDANGHYARIQPIFNAFQFTQTPGGDVLTPVRPSQRLDGLEFRQSAALPGRRDPAGARRLQPLEGQRRRGQLRL